MAYLSLKKNCWWWMHRHRFKSSSRNGSYGLLRRGTSSWPIDRSRRKSLLYVESCLSTNIHVMWLVGHVSQVNGWVYVEVFECEWRCECEFLFVSARVCVSVCVLWKETIFRTTSTSRFVSMWARNACEWT